jgi:mRNA-degrading endonuclease RelE of RelBE toxin-antitoxin system
MPNYELPLTLDFSDDFLKEIKKMDKHEAKAIVEKLKEFVATGAPRPKPLHGSFRKLSRLRLGSKRVIIELKGNLCTVLGVENRDKVYKR